MTPTPTADYLSFILSFPHIPPLSVFALFFLTLIRIVPIVSFVPFLGARLPAAVKMAVALALTAIMLPQVMLTTKHAISFNTDYIGYLLKDFFIGTILAFMASIPFFIAQSSGVLIDFLRGSSSLQVNDPSTQTQASPIGLLYNYVLIVLFFEINGPFIFFEGLAQSYKLIPADGVLNAAFFSASIPFWHTIMHLLTTFTALAMQLAAPSLVAILMAEMFLGIANRLAPQVQIAFLGMSIKSLLGIALLFAGWYFILQQMGKQSLLWLQQLNDILNTMQVR